MASVNHSPARNKKTTTALSMSQDLVVVRIRSRACNRKIAGSISVRGHFVTLFSKKFNLAMLTMAALAAATAALRISWDKIS